MAIVERRNRDISVQLGCLFAEHRVTNGERTLRNAAIRTNVNASKLSQR